VRLDISSEGSKPEKKKCCWLIYRHWRILGGAGCTYLNFKL
jgi:hypothetical protein